MTLTSALALPSGKGATALVGGGGKTSLMYALGAEYARAGRPAVVCTTTRIGVPGPGDARMADPDGPLAVPGAVVCIGKKREDGKLGYPGDALWAKALSQADRLFVEADGAKRLPVKAPAEYEPCLAFPGIDSVVAVAGLRALGRPLEEVCFRLELACGLLGTDPAETLSPRLLARLLTSPGGQFKNVGDPSRFRVFLNQADDSALTERGHETAGWIRDFLPGCRVVIGALKPAVRIQAVL